MSVDSVNTSPRVILQHVLAKLLWDLVRQLFFRQFRPFAHRNTWLKYLFCDTTTIILFFIDNLNYLTLNMKSLMCYSVDHEVMHPNSILKGHNRQNQVKRQQKVNMLSPECLFTRKQGRTENNNGRS